MRATHDPRPSIERLYGGSRERFSTRVDAAAAELVAERFLLADDVAAARAADGGDVGLGGGAAGTLSPNMIELGGDLRSHRSAS